MCTVIVLRKRIVKFKTLSATGRCTHPVPAGAVPSAPRPFALCSQPGASPYSSIAQCRH